MIFLFESKILTEKPHKGAGFSPGALFAASNNSVVGGARSPCVTGALIGGSDPRTVGTLALHQPFAALGNSMV